MLSSLRNVAKTWAFKILFAALILSFVVWGIGDIFRGPGREAVVANVGNQEISGRTFINEFRRQTKSLRDILGGTLNAERARTFGLVDRVMGGLVSRSLFDAAAQDLGLTVVDAEIRDQIFDDPKFQDDLERFNEYTFRSVLRENGFTEEDYIAGLRRDLTREQLVATVNGWLEPPEVMIKPLSNYRLEKRVAQKVFIKTEDIAGFDKPSNEALTTFYDAHKDEFKAPELRKVTYISLDVDDIIDEIEVPEERIVEFYEENSSRFKSPEQRSLKQILADTKEQAEKAHVLIGEGKSIEEAGKQIADLLPEDVETGWVIKQDIPERIADTVFSMASGSLSEPMESDFGWHVIKVVDVREENIKTLEDIRDDIRKELASDDALDGLYKLINQINDGFAGGGDLEEVALDLNLTPQVIEAIDTDSMDASGKEITGLPEKFTTNIFKTDEGSESDVIETENGVFVLRVDKITPPAILSFDAAKDKVAGKWKAEQQAISAEAQADLLLEQLQNGKEFAKVAEELGLTLETVDGFTRSNTAGVELTDDVVEKMFAAKVGDSVKGKDKDGFLVTKLTQIVAANLESDVAEVEAEIEILRRGISADLLAQYAQTLRNHYSITINDRVIDGLI